MAQLMSRLRAAVLSLGNEGALANVLSEMGRAAAARHSIEQLEVRMALAIDPRRASAAA